MIRYISDKQLPLSGFKTPFEVSLDENNRWVKLAQIIPWDELAMAYYSNLDATQGRPTKNARIVIGAVIIKHKLCLSDEETILQVQENMYLQYFLGLKVYQNEVVFVPSLFVEIRKRMGEQVFEAFEQSIIHALAAKKQTVNEKTGSDSDTDNDGKPGGSTKGPPDKAVATHQGKIILDATVVEQAIRFPTDLSLLNEAREISEHIIDVLYPQTVLNKKPRSYRQNARKAYLAIVKCRRPGKKKYRQGNKQQLQYLRRNLKSIETLLDSLPGREIPLAYRLLRQYWIIRHLYAQQDDMYKNKVQRCDDRLVSISQPHVRPIVRGKLNKPVEFGAKLSVSLTADGIACVDALRWDAFHEGLDLKSQVEAYQQRHGVYPEKVLADPLYGTRDNRNYLKGLGIHFAGKPLGRPKKLTDENKAQLKQAKQQRHDDYRQRIPIEGKFGQGKNGYGLNRIKAKTARTSEAWVRSIFLVMNLLVLYQHFLLPEIRGRYLGIVRQFILNRLGKSVNDTKYDGLFMVRHYCGC